MKNEVLEVFESIFKTEISNYCEFGENELCIYFKEGTKAIIEIKK